VRLKFTAFIAISERIIIAGLSRRWIIKIGKYRLIIVRPLKIFSAEESRVGPQYHVKIETQMGESMAAFVSSNPN
jgi:hypothetical protein